jgi:hypothetical protein
MEYSIRIIYSRALISFFVILLFVSFYPATAASLQSSSSPVLYVDPPIYRATHLGETFNITVKVADVSANLHLIGAEFKLQYNETLLETREEWFNEGNFFKAAGETFSKALVGTDDEGRKYVHAFVLLLPSTDGNYSRFPQGNGTLATITFNASYRPVEPLQASCELRLFDTILVDSDTNTIAHTTADGMYQIAPLQRPTLEVLPKKYIAYREGETFEIEVNIKEVQKDWQLTGLQFRLQYDTGLLETNPEWIVEGDFFKAYGSTWFQIFVENNYVIVGTMILPDQNGTWHEPFPEGNGTIATLKFKTIYQPLVPLDSSSCTLTLKDTILVNDKIEEIPHNTSDGEFVVVAANVGLDQYRPIDLQVDVGAIHFNGEIADFYVLVTDYGRAVDPDNIEAVLYNEGAKYMDLTANLEHVAKGLYRIPYTIPTSAQPGTYALLVQADYLQVNGSAIKSFLVSSTLDNWDTYISNIKDNIATIIMPTIGQIRLDLMAVNATLISISDRTATIQTTVGNLTTNLANLNIKIIKIDGDVATVQTSLGSLQGEVNTVKVKVTDLPNNVQTSINLLYVAVILALIAAIAAVLAFLNTRKKRI